MRAASGSSRWSPGAHTAQHRARGGHLCLPRALPLRTFHVEHIPPQRKKKQKSALYKEVFFARTQAHTRAYTPAREHAIFFFSFFKCFFIPSFLRSAPPRCRVVPS